MANAETQNLSEPKLAATESGEKIERNLHRQMADTVSNWISERRENNRTEDIFIDIWRYAKRARNTESTEKKLIAMIALRRLIKPSRQAKQISMANIDAPNEQGAGMDRISRFI